MGERAWNSGKASFCLDVLLPGTLHAWAEFTRVQIPSFIPCPVGAQHSARTHGRRRGDLRTDTGSHRFLIRGRRRPGHRIVRIVHHQHRARLHRRSTGDGVCSSGLGVLMRFVSGSVRTGFINALAILIFSAQMPHIVGANGATWAMVGLGLVVIYGLPRITTAVPSPLVCIVVPTLVGQWMHLPLKTVADLGLLPDSLPVFALPSVPFAIETLRLIALPAFAIAMVELLESMMTASVVDALTDTPSSKKTECSGLGIVNVAASLFGGIAGCGMIDQTASNVRYGGRGRLSTLFAGAFLLILIVLFKHGSHRCQWPHWWQSWSWSRPPRWTGARRKHGRRVRPERAGSRTRGEAGCRHRVNSGMSPASHCKFTAPHQWRIARHDQWSVPEPGSKTPPRNRSAQG